eukprot:s2839_g11.t1
MARRPTLFVLALLIPMPAFGSSPEASPSLSRSSRELSLATPWRSPQIVTCPSQDFGWPLIPASSERKD